MQSPSPFATRMRAALHLRHGEVRTLAVMGSFLLLNTANTTVLSAAKNGLFLSVYGAELIPYAVIFAALLTAAVAVVFTGVVAGTPPRRLALGLTGVLALSIVACRTLVQIDPRTAFAVYLWLSTVQVLVLTHAWEYAGSLLSGRQTKRILPLIGVGASIGAIFGGAGVAPAVRGLGTANLLWISVALLAVALPLVWLVREPPRDVDDAERDRGAIHAFAVRAGRGLRSVLEHRLLRLLAVGLIALTLTGTLIDLQLKFLLRATYERDQITEIYGLLSAGVGAGTLVLQLWASRVLFPRFGVSFAALLHGGMLTLASGGVAVFGGLAALVVAQALDDILQFSLQKPVEQVSLLPYPSRVRSVALATLGGVLRPLSKAGGGGLALLLAGRPALLPVATVASALVALAAYTRHRIRYMSALEWALTRHRLDLSPVEHTPLVVDASTLSIIDRGLHDPDPSVVVFATSLLEELPPTEAVPRLTELLGNPVPEVRAEAATVFGRLDVPLDFGTGVAMAARLAEEEVPYVLAALLETVGRVGGVGPESIRRFLSHDDADVRRAAVTALGRLGWKGAHDHVRALLRSAAVEDRQVGAGAVGDLADPSLLDALEGVLPDTDVRPIALESLVKIGEPSVPVMTLVLSRRELPLPLRRGIVTAIAAVPGEAAREALLTLVDEPGLGPAALTSLARMRQSGRVGSVDEGRLGSVLSTEMARGLRMSAAAQVVREGAEGPRDSFIAQELHALHERSLQRIMRILSLTYDPGRIDTIEAGLLAESPARRGSALELLEGTISKAAADLLVPYMDAVAEGMPLQRVLELSPDADTMRRDPATALLSETEWWPRALGLHMLGRDDEITTPGASDGPPPGGEAMIPLIEKVMLLKGSEFFRHFPGSDLGGIAAMADVIHFDAGQVIFEQGDEGDAFYLVVKGAVTISRGATKFATLGPREGFGEMAILDRETRSATATAAEDTTLLSLDRDSFDRIIEQNPVVARGVYRVLTERLRNTLAQVAAG